MADEHDNQDAGTDGEASGGREKEILGLMHSDPAAYEAAQGELQTLINQRLAGEKGSDAEASKFTADDLALLPDDESRSETGEKDAGDKPDADGDAEEDDEDSHVVPDTASDYRLPDPPQQLGERSEEDRALIADALKSFHEKEFTQAQVRSAIREFDKAQIKAAEARQAAALAKDAESEQFLKRLMPHDYNDRIESANALFREHLAEYLPDQKDRRALLDMRLEDGTRLGNYPPLVRALVDMASNRPRTPAPRQQQSNFESLSDADLAKEHREIMSLMHAPDDGKSYREAQPRLMKIIAAMNRRGRGG